MAVKNGSAVFVVVSVLLLVMVLVVTIVYITLKLTAPIELRSFTDVTDKVISGEIVCAPLGDAQLERTRLGLKSGRTTIVNQLYPSHNVSVACSFLVVLESANPEVVTIVYYKKGGVRVVERVLIDPRNAAQLWKNAKPVNGNLNL